MRTSQRSTSIAAINLITDVHDPYELPDSTLFTSSIRAYTENQLNRNPGFPV
jgi:hypothetical protein